MTRNCLNLKRSLRNVPPMRKDKFLKRLQNYLSAQILGRRNWGWASKKKADLNMVPLNSSRIQAPGCQPQDDDATCIDENRTLATALASVGAASIVERNTILILGRQE